MDDECLRLLMQKNLSNSLALFVTTSVVYMYIVVMWPTVWYVVMQHCDTLSIVVTFACCCQCDTLSIVRNVMV